MAGVGTVIKQVSKLSFSLHKMTETLNAIETTVGEAFNPTVVQEITEKVNQYESSIQNVESHLEKIDEQTKKVEKSGNLLSSVYKKVAGAVKTIDIKDVLNKSDELLQTMGSLNQINDGSQSTSQLFDMIYASAKDAHAPLMSMADAIITMGNSTGDLFGSNQELVDFMNQVNKQFVIGGASAQEQSSALDQLMDSMASGAIKGNELNTILDAAPGIAGAIEKNMGWAEGSLMSYANQGAVTADVVKASLLNMSDETNAAFENMPLTFAQVMTDIQSDATRIFQPVLEKLNTVTQSGFFGALITSAINGLAVVANITMAIMDSVGAVAGFIYENWSFIGPIIWGIVAALGVYYGAQIAMNAIEKAGVGIHMAIAAAQMLRAAITGSLTAATAAEIAAQNGLNASMYACPVVWITIAIIALIAGMILLANWIAKTTGIAKSGFGVIAGTVAGVAAFIVNVIFGILNFLITFIISLVNLISNFAGGLKLFFISPIEGIKVMFLSLLDFILGIAESIVTVIDTIFGSSIANTIEGFQKDIRAEIDTKLEVNRLESETYNASDYTFDRLNYGDSFEFGVAKGDGLGNKLGDLIPDYESPEYNAGEYDLGIPDTTQNDIAATADNTASLNDSVDISNENLKYLKDVAERDAINRFTTAPIKLTMNNHNNISSNMDLDGVINYLTIGMTDTINQAAEGVHA